MSRPSRLVPVMALLLSVIIAFASLLVTVTAEAAENDATGGKSESLPDDSTLLKLKVKDLKAILEKKGPDAACLACTSKQEYVSRIHETIDWPDLAPESEPTPAAEDPSLEDLQKMFTQGQEDERILELKKKLQDAGIDTSKMFTASGINRDELLKEKKKWEKLRDSIDEDDEDDNSNDLNEDDVKSDL